MAVGVHADSCTNAAYEYLVATIPNRVALITLTVSFIQFKIVNCFLF
jgi:hypothetical protein